MKDQRFESGVAHIMRLGVRLLGGGFSIRVALTEHRCRASRMLARWLGEYTPVVFYERYNK